MIKNLILVAGILLLTASCSKYVAKTYYKGQNIYNEKNIDENICRAKIAEKGPGNYPECKNVVFEEQNN
jgi:hypothetical protein